MFASVQWAGMLTIVQTLAAEAATVVVFQPTATRDEEAEVPLHWIDGGSSSRVYHSLPFENDDELYPAFSASCGKFMRRSRSWKRGSERNGSQAGSTLIENSTDERSRYALSSHSRAWSLSPRSK